MWDIYGFVRWDFNQISTKRGYTIDHDWYWNCLSNNVLFAFIQPEIVWYFNNSNLNTICAFSFSFSKRKTKTNFDVVDISDIRALIQVRKASPLRVAAKPPWSASWRPSWLKPNLGSLCILFFCFITFMMPLWCFQIVPLVSLVLGCFSFWIASKAAKHRGNWVLDTGIPCVVPAAKGLNGGNIMHALRIVVLRTWNMKVRQNWLNLQLGYTDSQKCSIPLTSLACVCTLRDWSS